MIVTRKNNPCFFKHVYYVKQIDFIFFLLIYCNRSQKTTLRGKNNFLRAKNNFLRAKNSFLRAKNNVLRAKNKLLRAKNNFCDVLLYFSNAMTSTVIYFSTDADDN